MARKKRERVDADYPAFIFVIVVAVFLVLAIAGVI